MSNPGLLRIEGRLENAKLYYSICHPAILHGKHKITKLIIYSEHLCLLNAGTTLVNLSLSRRYHIVGTHKAVHSVTRGSIVGRRASTKPRFQILGQLPTERLMHGLVFENVGVDYEGLV